MPRLPTLLPILPAALACATGLAGCSTGGGGAGSVAQPRGVDLYVEGYLLNQRGEAEAAERTLLAAVDQNPDLRLARATLGDIYRTRGDYTAAARQYEAAVRLDPYTLSNHYYLGLSYQYLRRLEEAAAAYRGALAIDPDDFDSNMNLGLVYLALNRLDEADYFLERATQIDPANALAWSNLGVSKDQRGSYILAEASYRQALRLDPASDVAAQNLGANLISQGKPGPAVETLAALTARSPTPATLKLYGDALALADEYAEADAQYDAALAASPGYAPALNGKGSLFIRRYEAGLELDDALRQRALAAWRQSLQADANQPRVRALLDKWTRGPIG